MTLIPFDYNPPDVFDIPEHVFEIIVKVIFSAIVFIVGFVVIYNIRGKRNE